MSTLGPQLPNGDDLLAATVKAVLIALVVGLLVGGGCAWMVMR